MTNQLITHRLPIDYSFISLMTLMSSIGYAWMFVCKIRISSLGMAQILGAFLLPLDRRVIIYTPGWREALWESSVLPKNSIQCPPPALDGVYLTVSLFQREPVVSTSWLSALEADSAWSSHPISVKVQRPEEIDDIFDTISYQKVNRLLVHTFNAMRGTGGATILVLTNKNNNHFILPKIYRKYNSIK